MVIKIRTSIKIDASVDAVWEVMSDMNAWGDWSKWTKFEFSEVKSGEKGTLLASFDGNDKWSKYTTMLYSVDKDKYFLNWGGGLGCLFQGNHWMQLTKISETETSLEHSEDFSGLLPALNLGMPFKKLEKNYALINEALKKQVEGNE